MSTYGQSSRKLELQTKHLQDFQRPVPILVQSNPQKHIGVPSIGTTNSLAELQGDRIPESHLKSDRIWQALAQSGNSTSVPPSQQLPWSHIDLNNSSGHDPLLHANQPGQSGAPDLINLPQGIPSLVQVSRAPHLLWNAAENLRIAGPFTQSQKLPVSATSPTNIGGRVLFPDMQQRPYHQLLTSEQDSSDHSISRPVSREYALERRRRAFLLKLSRPHRRARAAAATKTRAAFARALSGGDIHEVKSAEEVQQSRKRQRRVSNRDSVERCRNKQKLRLFGLEKERDELAQENETMKNVLTRLETSGLFEEILS